jgi:LysR family glycine cleavage system transcriptional activator
LFVKAEYSATEFLREHRVPVCSKALAKKLPLRKAADLRQHTLIHAAALPGVWAEWLEKAGVSGLRTKGSLTLDHFYLTLQAAVDGLGSDRNRWRWWPTMWRRDAW